MRRLRKLVISRRGQHVIIGITLVLIIMTWLTYPPANFPVKKQVTIAEGTSLSAIGVDLAEKEVIKFPFIFNGLVRLLDSAEAIKAGDYWFERPLNSWIIARRLIAGQFVLHPLKVTILEGSSPVQIAKMLREYFPDFDQEKLLELLAEKPDENFADTYFLPPEIGAERLVDIFRQNFRRQTAEMHARSLLSGRDWRDILIMSSIVEEEASDYETRQIIAGILWKRLDAKMPLQVDVARETYQRRGLPDQAIVNPSLEAIEATISPIDSPYWYYLADTRGVTYYAVDFDDHRQNIIKYLR